MPTTLGFSIAAFTGGDFLDEVKVGNEIELAKRRGTNGTFKRAKVFNPTATFDIKGGGASGLALGLSTDSITGLDGGVKYITKDDHTEKNNDFDDFAISGEYLPGATDQDD